MKQIKMQTYRNIAAVLGLSLCGISLYLIRRYWKNEEDDTLIRTSNFTTLEMIIPKKFVAEVIGKNGCNIKKIEVMSGTRINFRQGEERICVIRGTIEACHIAKSLIKEFIESLPTIEIDEVIIPRGVTSRIIGRFGDNINELTNVSGAKITITQEAGDSSISKVTLKGTKAQILTARSLIENKVQEFLELDAKLELALSKREPRAPPKTVSTESGDNSSYGTARRESLSRIIESPDTPFQVYVSALVDPSKFWIQIVGPKATELDRLVEDMTEFYNEHQDRTLYLPGTIQKGNVVAAVFKYDDKWYRAEVLSVDEAKEEAELHYVDYGDTDSVSFQNIMELRTDFLRLHFQAIECYLEDIEPVGGEWSEEAVDRFEEWTHVAQWKKLGARIKKYSKQEDRRSADREGSPVPGIELFEFRNGKDVSIGQKLIEHNYAIHKRESDSRPRNEGDNVSDNVSS